MIENAEAALSFAAGLQLQELGLDTMRVFAIIRALEVLGEAAHRVPDQISASHPEIPWRQLVDFRNVLIHGYDTIDLAIVVRVVNDELQVIVHALRRIASEMETSA
jgi:uncharacterized protein with HEPN domain